MNLLKKFYDYFRSNLKGIVGTYPNFDPKLVLLHFSIGRETVNRVAAEGARGASHARAR